MQVNEGFGACLRGPVWPWLLGPFIGADFKVNGSRKTQDRLHACLEALSGHLTEADFGHISEIFDGDPPIVRAAASLKPGALRKFCEPPSNMAPVEKRRKPGVEPARLPDNFTLRFRRCPDSFT